MTATFLPSQPGIVDVLFHGPPGLPRVVLEAPHGATTFADFTAVRDRLASRLPADLEAFFFVNTDVGSFELCDAIAAILASGRLGEPVATVVVRSRIPRTFIDCNRSAGMSAAELGAGGLTGLLPEYVVDDGDRTLLHAMHGQYVATAERAFALVCGAGGIGVSMHSYAPRSVGITTIDSDIVRALRAAYEPETYAQWPERPGVDLIHTATDGTLLTDPDLLQDVRTALRELGITPGESATYKLHPGTTGEALARRHTPRVLCVEVRRDLLAQPFDPFAEMVIAPAKVARFAAPLAACLARALQRGGPPPPGQSQETPTAPPEAP